MPEILIICETGPGRNELVNARLLAQAQEIAGRLGWTAVALVAGPRAEASANDFRNFVDEVLFADSPALDAYNPEVYLALVGDLCGQRGPRLILLGHTQLGMDLAPRLAVKLDGGLVTSCIDVLVDSGERSLTFVRPMYKGRLLARVVLRKEPAVITLQPSGASVPTDTGPGSVARLAFSPPEELSLKTARLLEPTRGQVDITKADVVVAAGRGIGERENLALVRDLADALGGVPACSRPLVDVGWLGADHQVGMSGRTVRPKLYVACGISGAPEHLMGIKGSEIVVAINTDPEAPIFKLARYGIVGDLMDVLPALTRKVRAGSSTAGDPRTPGREP
jgi:electron transfer flavoprotein alpha subunit